MSKASVKKAREFVSDVLKMAKARGLNCFIVTDGASGITNNGNDAVRHARECQIQWERENGFDPDEDWSKAKNETADDMADLLFDESFMDLDDLMLL